MSTHFLTHEAKRYVGKIATPTGIGSRRVYVKRALCQAFVAESDGRALRESAVVTCQRCMVAKDAWLEMPKRKPLTVRRLRVLVGQSAGWTRDLRSDS